MPAQLLLVLSSRPTDSVPVLFRGSWTGDIDDVVASVGEDDLHDTALPGEAEGSLSSLNSIKGVLIEHKNIFLIIFMAVKSISFNYGLRDSIKFKSSN